ncbi:MAG: histidinol-phosphate aminotransferase family protein [Oscillospiraceae bacterium]|nr:histidinol-phosphate aminotransferase family protein [Oscillospiraceae bacterium]
MYELNSKLKKVEPYDPIEGQYKIRLDANESFFNINETIGDKIAEEVKKVALNRYPDPQAAPAVKAFADYYGIPEKYVTAGNGSDELISIITSCFLETGDKILTLSPDFSMYAFYSSMYELEVETMQKEPSLHINIAKVIAHCNNSNVKAVIFSNPCNPTSLGVTRQDVIRLVKNVFCLVIIDEAYMDFWDQSILDEVENYDNLIILKTCSKSMGLAGIRMGFAVAGDTITTALRSVKSPYNTDSISQAVCAAALSEKELLKQHCADIVESRKTLYEDIVSISKKYARLEKVYDSVTNFVFIKTAHAKEIYDEMEKRSIAIRYMGSYIRITAGNAEENAAVTAALIEILKEMKKED